MDFGFLGGLMGLLGPFKTVYDYFEKSRERGDVAERLKRGMTSIKKFQTSLKAIDETGRSNLSYMEGQSYPLDKKHFEELLRRFTQYFDDFAGFLGSINEFGRDCCDISGLTGFMERVKKVNPDVFDIIGHFAKHYDPKKGEMDLTGLPTLMKVVGGKGAWKDDKKAEEQVKKAVERAKAVAKRVREGGTSKYLGLDKRLAIECLRSFERLVKTAKSFRATKETINELRANAPAWFREVADLFDEVERQLKKTQEKKFYTPRKQSPPPSYWPRRSRRGPR